MRTAANEAKAESIRARVVMAADRTALAWALSLLGGVAAGSTLLYRSPGDFLARHGLGLAFLLWLVGPLLVRRARERRTTVQRCSSGILVGGIAVARGSAVSVARGDRGLSVAVGTPRGVAFVEVETEEEARRITAWLGAPLVGVGELSRSMARGALRAASAGASVLGLVPTFIFLVAIALDNDSNEAIFGSLPLAVLSSTLFVVSRLFKRPFTWGKDQVTLPRAPIPRSNSAADRHTRLHAHSRISTDHDAKPDDDATVRVRVLAQGLEPTNAWLARIDMIGAEGGYRGDWLTREELVRIVEDDTEQLDARLAAARVLSRRYQEPVDRLRFRVGPSLEGALEAVLEAEADAAAERLDVQRPLFRAE